MTPTDLLTALSALEPVKKPVIPWQSSLSFLDPAHALCLIMEQMARVTRRITVDLRVALQPQVAERLARAVQVAQAMNAKIALACQPFYGLSNGVGYPLNTAEVDERVKMFAGYLAIVLEYVKPEMAGEVLIDQERFVADPYHRTWNAALLTANNRFYLAAKNALPAALFAQWESHCESPSPNANSWQRKPWTTGAETADLMDMTLYCLPNESGMREALNRTKTRGTQPIMAWVALGAGTRQMPGQDGHYDRAWAFPNEYAWWAGRWLASDARVSRIGLIVDPQPDTEHPSWLHNVEFFRGMNGVVG